ncbi:DUF4178 domain-containing protein [Clostridium vincentii]|uniref:DUF4178 domain-containing protein n=1 Tax=Clostridium vincentii TaxID=52704 RepID=A0A2T0BJK3_9CLOT|nr:DUF4178 domain-containing protein [Clostridium vincentii]PRR84064.1 hypothetical protein CLVI_03620 [Clostridium vincentii]
MADNNLYFGANERLSIEGREYIVQGFITFLNDADSYKWTEYKIKLEMTNEIKWLSIDRTYNEYALYTQCKFSSDFKEKNIILQGYKESDYGQARVTAASGAVDVVMGDRVSYREFEDLAEEKIMAIETWEEEEEYSRGYYLNADDIKKVGNSSVNYVAQNTNTSKNPAKISIVVVAAIIVAACVAGICIYNFIKGASVPISNYIGSSSSFSYYTSITSDNNNDEKADIYKTSLSVEDAVKLILDKVEGNVEDVQENTEDKTVGIITKKEYCLVYTSTDNKTLVQISTRKYAYSSNNNPYHSNMYAGGFYRRYYYSRGYTADSKTYGDSTSSYADYNDGTVNNNTSDKYKTYSNSVRQSSISSRTSSGGGTSSGK